MILFTISFVAGFLTVLAPCILPLLPVIVGGSLTSGAKEVQKKKVFTIVIALAISVILFTLLLKVSTIFIEIPPSVWQWISGGIITVFGLVILLPSLWEGKFLAHLSAELNRIIGTSAQKNSFWGDVTIGAALGPVFATCSPTYFVVLASVLPAQPVLGVIYLIAYAVGLSLALLLVAFAGQKIMNKLNIAADPRGWFKRILGIIFVIVGIAIITGYEKKLEVAILDSGFFDVTQIEQKLLELTEPNTKNDARSQADFGEALSLAEKEERYMRAHEISTPDGFVNTGGEPITLESLRGQVVLLDIWTYSCINCQRTIPYLNDWYENYRDDGLVIIGLHTPEFGFEKVVANVQNAVEEFDIEYPVVLDNDYSTWRAYENKYWPRKYLIDIDGFIVYDHIGEGGYEETELAIQKALYERNERLGLSHNFVPGSLAGASDLSVQERDVKSPEVYFGSRRNTLLANGTRAQNGEQDLVLPEVFELNKLYLGGTWNITGEYAESVSEASVVFRYSARNVFFVAGSEEPMTVSIYQDGEFVRTISVTDEKLYTLIENEIPGEHILELRVSEPGLQLFTFTFG